MTWQEKMNLVIGEVLGEGYSVKVISDEEFEVYYVDMRVLKRDTISSKLANHWRQQIKDVILIIIDVKIQTALAKI